MTTQEFVKQMAEQEAGHWAVFQHMVAAVKPREVNVIIFGTAEDRAELCRKYGWRADMLETTVAYLFADHFA
jgi:rubrerythrin